ncbi:MAG: hypothetical protein NUV80_05710 [Candidatus Berkelbacteria bacterium]|nr:hypothetical protein [Candidatus Berkelbacteria bacterium]MCR4308030.1 hypothetical protein [Candidatus Berkelbacteria bacterium]
MIQQLLVKPHYVLRCSVKKTGVPDRYRAILQTLDGIQSLIVGKDAVVRGGIKVFVNDSNPRFVLVRPVGENLEVFRVRPSQVVPLKSRGA